MGLIGWWPLHTESGNVVDLSGETNGGSTTGGVKRGLSGKGGLNSMGFNGSDSGVNISDIKSLDQMSLSVWLKGGNGNIAFQLRANNEVTLYKDNPGAQVNMIDGGNNNISVSTDAGENDEWVHVVFTWDGRNMVLYVNGDQKDHAVQTGMDSQGLSDSIGYNSGGDNLYYQGEICDVRLYDHVISISEVKELYRQGGQISPPEDGVSRYEFEGDATDSWHSNDGTVNGATFTSGKFGQVASFDGSNDLIETNNNFTQKAKGKGTFSCWLKIDDSGTGNQPVFVIPGYQSTASHPADRANIRLVQPSSGQLKFEYEGADDDHQSVTFSYPQNKWFLFTGSYDVNRGFLKAYVDGAVVASNNSFTNQDLGGVDYPLHIGGYGGNQVSGYMSGLIDDFRFYDRALKSSEVKALYHGYNDLAQPPGASDPAAVSRYKFDDSVNSTIIDSWGSNDGTDNTSAGYVNGVRGKAKDFDGSDDYIVTSQFDPTSNDAVTLSMWMNGTVDGTWPLSFYADSNNRIGLNQQTNTIEVYSKIGGTAYQTSEISLASNVWNHVVGVMTSNRLELYINGSLATSKSISATPSNIGAGELYIASFDGSSNFFSGKIDDVRIYSRALKPWEIHELYRWGTGGRDMRRETVNKR